MTPRYVINQFFFFTPRIDVLCEIYFMGYALWLFARRRDFFCLFDSGMERGSLFLKEGLWVYD